ncbi:UNVERIFIED_CONTAM: hypothetical protein GTU68_014863 [Idotea baltica]|nr:hypothetical protein [Idotea baltica]
MKILLIEDYAPLRKAIVQAVKEMGWVAEVACDGEEGLWALQNQTVDVIVLDLMLPKIHGLDLLERFRSRGKNTPILILTAQDGVEERVKGLDLGADDYLVKPFFLTELLSRLKALIRRSYGDCKPFISEGSLELDLDSRKVTLKGQTLELSAREYALLEFLMRRRGKITTRTEIWDHVYQSHSNAGSNVVDVYIGYLRKKLHKEGGKTYLHTKRGQGYILEELEA